MYILYINIISLSYESIFEYTLCFIVLCRYSAFYKLRICGNPELSKKTISTFLNSIYLLYVCVSYFDNSHNISNFFIIIFVMALCDHWSLMLLWWLFWGTMNGAYITWQTVNKCCVCSTDWPFLSFLRHPCSLRHNTIEIRPVSNPAMSCKCSDKTVVLSWKF